MRLLHRLAAVVRRTLHRQAVEAELDEDVRTFVEMAAAAHVRDGVSPEEARRLALVALGGVEQTKERIRAERPGSWLEIVWRDAAYGVRQLRRNRGFAAVAIATLALGIGFNTAMFSAVDAVLIRPLPYADADRLVMIWDDGTETDGERKFFSTPPEWVEWRRHNTVFTDIAASQPGDAALSGIGDPEDLPARKVTGNFWNVLGVRPLLGRVFNEAEDANGARVVVVSYGLWQRRLGASAGVIGQTITLNDTPYEVVGVMPREFYFMPARDIDVWMPASMPPGQLTSWGWHDVQCIARLRPGVTVRQAGESMAALGLRLSAQHVRPAHSAVVSTLREELAGKSYASLVVLLAATGVVLLITCVNLANLLLARSASRRREVAVRMALGAGRGRLVVQFLAESLVLALFGGVAGLAIAVPAMRFLETLVPPTMVAHLTMNWRVLAVTAGVAIAAGVICGLLPALRGSRFVLEDALRDGGRTGTRRYRLQHTLVVAETALAVMLLTTGGLLLQTFQHLRQLDLGIRGERVLTLETPLFRYRDFDRRVAFVDAELERIRAVPGVIQAAAISRIPLTAPDQATFYRFAGQAIDDTVTQVALSRVVTRGYFTTMGASLREGRFFDISDRRSDAPVAIVNESFAGRHFAGRSPLGARLQFGNRGPKGYWYTIVGVVKEIRDRGVAPAPQPTIYRVHEQADQTNDQPSGIVVRTAGDPAAVVAAVRAAIWSLDKNQPVARVQTIDDIVGRQLAVPSQNTVLLGAFAVLALVLASIGLFGVLSYAVTQRTKEIAVRMALGATAGSVVVAFSRRGLTLTVAGLVIGVALARIAAGAMATLFYDWSPNPWSATAAASAALLMVAAVASTIPALRASRIAPAIALQQD